MKTVEKIEMKDERERRRKNTRGATCALLGV
jgi:hypothetical protein